MARSDQLRREISSLETKVAGLQQDQTRAQKTANDATAAARRKRDEAARTKSDSTRRMALSTAERKEKEATTASSKVADLSRKIADANKSIATKRTALRSAEDSEQRDRDRAVERRRQKEQNEQRARDREDGRRRQKEKDHAREVARLSRPATQIRYVEVQPPKPEPLRVLYLTANPHTIETTIEYSDGSSETNGVWLRVDQEVRQVKQSLRASKWRDLVTIEHLPAATGMDLVDGLNDHRPHVVHFSGHASGWGVLLEDEAGSQDGAEVEFALLAKVLGATDEPPRLVVLNACESLEGADDLLRTVPTVIGMSESITDLAAVTFAARFYAAIAAAQSVATAVEQARTAMQMASLEDSHLPEIRTREDVDPTSLVLVTSVP
ncbi:CHAT domain-containing protein [uncultured Ornithinimicrobium sp.]|uniref:CHAT domain-containing protein n=1 Tax=uncultured Ornithinimicrobium sp. TaxID=259307 RepID=UPI00259884A9|nr:CHAT domain-containing protein [uncultured Ornithinimicrobium sp.]